MHQECAVRDSLDRDVVQASNGLHDGLAVRRVYACNGDIADRLTSLGPHEVDRAKDRAGLADGAGDPGERSGSLPLTDARRDAVRRRRLKDGRRVAWSALASGIGVVIWATSGAASLLRADLRGR